MEADLARAKAAESAEKQSAAAAATAAAGAAVAESAAKARAAVAIGARQDAEKVASEARVRLAGVEKVLAESREVGVFFFICNFLCFYGGVALLRLCIVEL